MNVPVGPALSQYRGNCALVALRQVLNHDQKSDDDIRLVCERNGYPLTPYGRMTWDSVWKAAGELGLELQSLTPYDMNYEITVAQFCHRFPEGTFLVGVRGHIFVVRNGVVVDPNYSKLRSRAMVRRGDTRRVLNDGFVPRQLDPGFIKPVRLTTQAKRRGSATFTRYGQMWAFTQGDWAPLEAVLRETPYTRADLAFDVAHGHVVQS